MTVPLPNSIVQVVNPNIGFWTRITKHPATIKKFIVALVGAVLVAISLGLLPESWKEWVTVVVSFLTSIGVYVAPRESDPVPVLP